MLLAVLATLNGPSLTVLLLSPSAMKARIVFSEDDEIGFSYNNICQLTSESFNQCPINLRKKGWLVKICDVEGHVNSTSNPNPNDGGIITKAKLKLGDCVLWNSVTSEVIQLPSLLNWITSKSSEVYYLYLSVLSSSSSPSPTQLGGDSVSRVFLLFNSTNRESDYYLLLYCRPGDNRWLKKKLEISYCSVQSLICIRDDKLYIMCDYDRHLEIEIFDTTLTIRSFSIKWRTPYPSIGGHCSFDQSEFVKAGDEIYRVVKHCYPGNVNDKVFEIHVYRMSMSSMVWEEVRSLGDFVFFLDEPPTTAAYYSAADFGLTRGCLYYTMQNDKSLYKFDLEDNSITMSLSRPTLFLSSANWVTTPTSLTSTTDTKRRKVMLAKAKEKEDTIVLAPKRKTRAKDEEIRGPITSGILNEDIMISIANYLHLHPIDMVNFRSISRSNRLVIPPLNWNSPSVKFALSLSQLLVYYRKDETIYNFVDPMRTNGKYVMELSKFLLGATIRFSKGGWLLMSRGSVELFFFNPFTRKKIKLPKFSTDVGKLSTMCFSSLPSSSDCKVFAITKHCTAVEICAIRRGIWLRRSFRSTDEFFFEDVNAGRPWLENHNLRPIEDDKEFTPSLSSPVFYQGAFYCLDVNGTLGVCRVGNKVAWDILSEIEIPCNLFNQCFLVEWEENLLALFVGNIGQTCEIYRLDFSDMKWVEVESLGKHALFLSNTSCFSAVARDRQMENKIYLSRFLEESIIYYSLDTGKYHSVGRQHSANNFYNTKEWLACSWIEPNWS